MNNSDLNIHKRYYPDVFAYNFYVLLQLELDIKSFSSPAHSIAKLKKDVVREKKKFVKNLADMLYDYLLIAGAGEARHCQVRDVEKIIKQIPYAERDETYLKSVKFCPDTLGNSLLAIFNKSGWGGHFGGKKWANIIQTALDLKKARESSAINPLIELVDTVFSLEHNSGSVFNKAVIFADNRKDSLKHVLNWKFEKNILEYTSYYFENVLIDLVANIWKRANVLNVIKQEPRLTIVQFSEMPYEPIKWGKKKVTISSKKKVKKKTVETANSSSEKAVTIKVNMGSSGSFTKLDPLGTIQILSPFSDNYFPMIQHEWLPVEDEKSQTSKKKGPKCKNPKVEKRKKEPIMINTSTSFAKKGSKVFTIGSVIQA